jgi:hypothetical protein
MKAKDESKELQDLINMSGLSFDQAKTIIDKNPEELNPEPIFEIDYKKEKKKYKKKARRDVINLVKSIVPNDVIESPIIQNKIEQDTGQLANLYWQQKMIEAVLEANMDSIGKGNLAPRMFEVFTQISKNHSDIAKQITDFQVMMRKNYNEMKWDIRAKIDDDQNLPMLTDKKDDVKIIDEQKNENMFLGSKSLISDIVNIKKKEALKNKKETENE